MSDRVRSPFASIAALFFVWGFVSANNDPLLVALKQLYTLSWFEALLTHFMFAIAFGLVSIPAAMLGGRMGLAGLIPLALATMAVGCGAVALLAGRGPYGMVLVGLFVTASGVVCLQVAANPLAALAGPADRSHWRLNFAQSLNSLGVVIGANSGAVMLFAPGGDAGDADGVAVAYGAMAVSLLILAVWIKGKLGKTTQVAEGTPDDNSPFAAFRSRWALYGAAAIGLYVGAEVTLSSLMAGFLHQPAILGSSFREGGILLANVYWGGALAGRLAGIVLLKRFRAATILGVSALAAVGLCVVAMGSDGLLAAVAALAVGLANAMMFPVIFSLTLERAGIPAAAVSGLLCAAIVGGAMLPLAAGHIADGSGFAAALALPLGAYLFIAFFARSAGRTDRRSPENDPMPLARPRSS